MAKNKTELRKVEMETLKTLKRVDESLWTLEYKNPYFLDDLLAHGAKSILGFASFMQRQLGKKIVPNPVPGGFACSTFNTVNPLGQPIMGRNFDYKDSLCAVVWTSPEDGFRSMSTISGSFLLYGKKWQRLDKAELPLRLIGAPYTCMDGINEKGLAGAILEIKAKPTKQNTGKTPIIPPCALRAALDRCETVDEAVNMFASFDMQDLIGVNYHYMFTDARGCSAIIEYVDNKMNVLRQKTEGENLVLTNYFLSEGGDNSKGRGFDRYKNIESRLCECENIMSEEDAMQLLGRNTLYYHHKWMPHMVTTVWSNVFNCAERTQLTCAGMNYSTAYRFALDAPGEYEKITVDDGNAAPNAARTTNKD